MTFDFSFLSSVSLGRRQLLVAVCLIGASGCGGAGTQPSGNSTPATAKDPATNSSTAASTENGPPTPTSAESRPVEKLGAVIFAASDLAKVTDFTKLAKVDGTKLEVAGPARLSAQVPGKVRDVANFYLAQFAKQGWKRGGRPSDRLSDEYASATLLKDGHLIEMSAYTSGDRGEVSVSLISHGNFDARALPRVKEAKLLYGDQAITSYVTLNKLPDEAEAVFKALMDDGWQPYSRLHAGNPVAARDRRSFELRKRGYSLDVTVDVAPAQNNQTFVQYAVYALSHELPTPPEATDVEFDDERWGLQCNVPGEFRTAAVFYRKVMPDLGYKPLPSEDPRDTYWNLRFGTAAEDVVLVQANSKDGKTTRVLITGIPAAVVAEMKRTDGGTPAPAAERP